MTGDTFNGTGKIRLALFLSRATPLQRWRELGTFERETSIYRLLRQRLAAITIITSGGPEERELQPMLSGIQIMINRRGYSSNLYSLLSPILHRRALREHTLYQTNQLDGAWSAVLAGKLFRKPVIVRAGYGWAELHRQEHGGGLKSRLLAALQRFSYRHADHIIVTTGTLKDTVMDAYDIPEDKIEVIPNYVDTELMKPMPELVPITGRIIYIGRLHSHKNLDLLIPAIAGIDQASLLLIGRGEQRAALEQLAAGLDVKVEFAGVQPNSRLPAQLNQSELFVLLSDSEGHPKSLLEAMACGRAVLGTDVPGIRELIDHGKTGWLCRPDAQSIHSAIAELLASPDLRFELGRGARRYVQQHFSLDRVANQWAGTLATVANKAHHRHQ